MTEKVSYYDMHGKLQILWSKKVMYCTGLLYNNQLNSNGTEILEVIKLAHFYYLCCGQERPMKRANPSYRTVCTIARTSYLVYYAVCFLCIYDPCSQNVMEG